MVTGLFFGQQCRWQYGNASDRPNPGRLGFHQRRSVGAIAEEQQQRPGRTLGKVAEDLGYVTDEQLAQALAEQWGMQVIHLADIVVPPQVLGYVTEPMAHSIGSCRSVFATAP